MRFAELLALAACALATGSALGHGVHDLRGEVRVEAERLLIEIESSPGPSGERLCLRLLNDLQVRTDDGERLVGTAGKVRGSGRCLLDYAMAGASETLILKLEPARRDSRRNERLVLVPPDDGDLQAEPLVLGSRGPAARLRVVR